MGLLSAPPHTTLFEVLRRHAELDQDRPWLTFERDDGEARSWTYGDFTREVALTAGRLAELGIGRGSGSSSPSTTTPS